MDVVLDAETEDVSPLIMELEEKMQSILMPLLAGCTEEGDSRDKTQGIINALIDPEVVVNGECLPDSERPCDRFVSDLYIYSNDILPSAELIEVINTEFRALPLEERLELLPPFKTISIVNISEREAIVSANPSGKYNQNKAFTTFHCPLTGFLWHIHRFQQLNHQQRFQRGHQAQMEKYARKLAMELTSRGNGKI
mmetsp:Transcript_7699/g.18538  ORF Transcript_7699/g.18538 Transcript_7699/m.18538 type:complete len:196 (-) Transcript_7699:89-676(-)